MLDKVENVYYVLVFNMFAVNSVVAVNIINIFFCCYQVMQPILSTCNVNSETACWACVKWAYISFTLVCKTRSEMQLTGKSHIAIF